MKLICLQTWVPLRKEAASASEMVSSLLFGETCELLERKDDWLLVQCDFDAYEGWIPENYLEKYTEEYANWSQVLGAQSAVLMQNSFRIHLSAGSNLPNAPEINIRQETWKITIRDTNIPVEPWQLAMGFLHVPYLWGGRSDCGIDCSGLIQVVFKIKGLNIPRDSADQATLGETVEFGEHISNDLAFFENGQGKITHVGIVSNHGFIHASGRVRKDELTNEGIVAHDSGLLTHKLSVIKRLKF